MLLWLLVVIWPVNSASAHMSTTGYSDVSIDNSTIRYQLYLEPEEYDQWLDSKSNKTTYVFDPSAPPKSAWETEDVQRLITEGLFVNSANVSEPATLLGVSMKQRENRSYMMIDLEYDFPATIHDYAINYDLFFDGLDPQHQNFAKIRYKGSSVDMVFNQDHRLVAEAAETSGSRSVKLPSWLVTIFEYIGIGIHHIWTGIDHLLFVTALIILPQRKRDYLKTLTAFTIGHSITLILASLKIVNIPVSVVEPLIALSIVYVAVENIWLRQIKWRWALSLGFGLIHGLGFAEVLRDAFLNHFMLSLFSFNVGVEIGQIGVLLVLLPIVVFASKWRNYRYALGIASGLIALMGAIWVVERTLL
ncbi:hypothetical protein A8709_21170 [Paenibacillus pectinilyticus]|uniref:HupE / UreJ protein n=1 Tax=Paenibacillus pectinilyticus TaxID=512399 RepID=A0A1C0ZXJ1_9BACL|nr:HupE/UreJ family protein [Paenibacillus pectinilyticus]OCT12846.1 hypothetical protein A8709_21170 [Paenibacillus pectinilyticus]